ncbi:MAG: tyrosine-type recombinase/integrase [Phycisphaeraceae bacterium]|nr:MAG: tyrosine-type recombinase/integrase [Phycisphaeraceae bacterium]
MQASRGIILIFMRVPRMADTQLLITDPLHRQMMRATRPEAARVIFEWLTAEIRNPNTRAAYYRALQQWSEWLEDQGGTFEAATTLQVASFIETHRGSLATIKQRLAAIRGAYGRLTERGVIDENPALRVRGPRFKRLIGATTCLTRDEATRLLSCIDGDTDRDLRDRAVIATMLYTWQRVSSVCALDLADLVSDQGVKFLRFQVKGGHAHAVPVHSKLRVVLDRWIERRGEWAGPLFVATDPTNLRKRTLTRARMNRAMVANIIRTRSRQAGIETIATPHTMRATAITNYLENGGNLEVARRIARHKSINTTRLYDRTGDELKLTEVERVNI